HLYSEIRSRIYDRLRQNGRSKELTADAQHKFVKSVDYCCRDYGYDDREPALTTTIKTEKRL
ncbi:hypothetical protein, partial [Ruminococcus sp.]|uniref:hypothetical protein n=1 Tax=Ruminococcus sp. TaxID=41978 RepID=UPI002E7705F4